ncbi:hypothetical protein LJK88_04465 [Paenibacillus sp. P26]|nr:hypothetical protein LJK88_04465 [Paenibacillus sp. P26]UUZ90673.1 hypothetical protein LJK87_33045 [Paenibacillus sp. P25]
MSNSWMNPSAVWMTKVLDVLEAQLRGEDRVKRMARAAFQKTDGTTQKRWLRERLPDVLSAAGVPLDQNLTCCKHSPDKHPSMRYDKRTYALQCFACMDRGKTLDLFDLIGLWRGLSKFSEIFKIAERLFVEDAEKPVSSLPYHKPGSSGGAIKERPTVSASKATAAKQPVTNGSTWKQGKSRIYRPLEEDLSSLRFLHQRGITRETAERFKLKWWENSKTQDRYIVIPCEGKFCVRRMYQRKSDFTPKYLNSKKCPVTLFNGKVLKTCPKNSVVFVVESALDAILLEQMGFRAVATNSAGNYKLLLEKADIIADRQLRLICLCDNDPEGKDWGLALHLGLLGTGDQMNYPVSVEVHHKDFSEPSILTKYKDVGEAFKADLHETEKVLKKLEDRAMGRLSIEESVVIMPDSTLPSVSAFGGFGQSPKE